MSKYNQVIYSNVNESDSWTLDKYLEQGGYSVWKNILTDQTNKSTDWVIEEAVSYTHLTLPTILLV